MDASLAVRAAVAGAALVGAVGGVLFGFTLGVLACDVARWVWVLFHLNWSGFH